MDTNPLSPENFTASLREAAQRHEQQQAERYQEMWYTHEYANGWRNGNYCEFLEERDWYAVAKELLSQSDAPITAIVVLRLHNQTVEYIVGRED